MNPIFNTLMAILHKAELLTPEAAEKMAVKMQGSIHQSKYSDAVLMVEDVSDNVDHFVAEPWNNKIAGLEARISKLEKLLTKKK
jgi:hypothetical protein